VARPAAATRADAAAPVAVAPADLFGAPAFAAGRAFAASTLDALLCEAHFAPHLIMLIKGLVQASRKQQWHLLPIADAVAMAMLASPAHSGSGSDSGSDSGGSGYRNAATGVGVPATPSFPRITTYGHLFEALLRGWHLLPMGLYRRRRAGETRPHHPSSPTPSHSASPHSAASSFPGSRRHSAARMWVDVAAVRRVCVS